MKVASSEMNLGSNLNGNGMKASASAFEILSRSNSNGDEDKEEAKDVVEKKKVQAVERPKTFK